MMFQVFPGFRKNSDDMEQRSMFELLEIRRFQQFHFQDEIFVELVRRQIIHQEELVDHIHARRVPHLRKICLSYVIQRKEFHFLSKRSASKTGIVHAINPYRILMKILLRHHNRIIFRLYPFYSQRTITHNIERTQRVHIHSYQALYKHSIH